VHYYRVTEPLPGPDDIPALAEYWKTYFNTYAKTAKGTTAEFIKKYRRYVLKQKPLKQKPLKQLVLPFLWLIIAALF
jgi:hypothetical protein